MNNLRIGKRELHKSITILLTAQ